MIDTADNLQYSSNTLGRTGWSDADGGRELPTQHCGSSIHSAHISQHTGAQPKAVVGGPMEQTEQKKGRGERERQEKERGEGRHHANHTYHHHILVMCNTKKTDERC